MSKLYKWGIPILFIVLTVIYYRYAIFSPIDSLMTRHLATDLMGHFQNIIDMSNQVKQGHIPIGDFWVYHGGGYASAFNNQLFYVPDLLLLPLYLMFGSFALSLKILYISSTLLALWMSYKYGLMLLKRRSAAVIVAIGYAFCLYGINQLEHPDLYIAKVFVLIALILLEKVIQTRRNLYIVLLGIILAVLWLTSPYPLYFVLLFIFMRYAWHIYRTRNYRSILNIIYVGIIFVLLAFPFVLITITKHPSAQYISKQLITGLDVYAVNPMKLFVRQTSYIPYSPEIHFFYGGLTLIALAVLPIIFRKARSSKWYIFSLIVFVFCVLYSAVFYSPINIAKIITTIIPLTYFIRVSGRIMIIGYLSLAICAAIGFTLIKWKYKSVLLVIAVLAIFADLTIGYEPPVKYGIPDLPAGAYEFIAQDKSDFRIMEYPSVNGQESTTYMTTGKDVLSSAFWASGLYAPLEYFIDTYDNFEIGAVSPSQLRDCGVKYIIIITDPAYYIALDKALPQGWRYTDIMRLDSYIAASDSFENVYQDSKCRVYQNKIFAGMAYSLDGAQVSIQTSFNKVTITANKPTTLILSQSYDKKWVADNGTIEQYGNIDKITMNGTTLTMTYSGYSKWMYALGGCWFGAVITILLLIKYRSNRDEDTNSS